MKLTAQELEAFRLVLRGTWRRGDGLDEPVYRQVRYLEPGQVLYRGCTAGSIEHALEMLRSPRYTTTSKDLAQCYARWHGASTPPMSLLLTFRVRETMELAKVASRPVLDAANDMPGLLERGNLGLQSFQRLYLTELAEHYADRSFDGVWDNDGADVLIVNPRQSLEVVGVERR